MLKMSSGTNAADLTLECGAAARTIPTYFEAHAISVDTEAHRSDHVQQCPSEQFTRLPADAQAELDRLRSVAQHAGYTITFRDPNGIIIEYQGNPQHNDFKKQARGGLAPGALRRVREYVEVNLESRIELANLAAVAKLSRCHFAHAFKQSLGCTPRRYVVSRRLEKAHHLLVTSNLAIAEIALASGFADQSHFSRCFGEFFGASPMAFRRSRRFV